MDQHKSQGFAALVAPLALATSACAGCDAASPSIPDGIEAAAEAQASVNDAGTDGFDASGDALLDASLDTADAMSCPTDWPDACVSPAPSWMNSVEAIINNRCYPCHFPGGVMYPRVDLSNYNSVHRLYGPVLSLEEACAMPPADAAQPTRAEREELVAWLVCGAPDN